jgi:hypothetical protein
MAFILEVYRRPPSNTAREAVLTQEMDNLEGRLDFREEADEPEQGAICLTYEFDDPETARTAVDMLRDQGEMVEGPFRRRL